MGVFSTPNTLFFADVTITGTDSGIGSDMNCDGAVNTSDMGVFTTPNTLFFGNVTLVGSPGPSGLSCAGALDAGSNPQAASGLLCPVPDAMFGCTPCTF